MIYFNVPYTIVLIVSGFHHLMGLQLTHIAVPQLVDFRDRAPLSCSYDMGGHKLNSVKWYKDGLEFFRYSPMMQPNYMTFRVDGITISSKKIFCNEIICNIELDQLTPASEGVYRCEVSGDAPEFKLITKRANMTIAALPQHDPIVSGISQTYRFDDFVVVNCTSDWSSPAATLSWYINDEKASSELLQPQQETTINTDGFSLRSRSLEIRFHIDRTRFINTRGILKMKCLANIERIPFLAREKTVKAFILSKDDLSNQKLVNWRNTAYRDQLSRHLVAAITATFNLPTLLQFIKRIILNLTLR